MPGIGGAAAAGATAAQGNRNEPSAGADQQAAFGQAVSQARGHEGQPQDPTGDQTAPRHDEESCTVEVRTRPIAATGNVARHAYIVTSEDSPRAASEAYLGKETVHRGGPERRVQEPADGTTYGDIITDSLPFEPGRLDHPGEGAAPRPSVPVGTYPGNCDEIDMRLEAAGQQIEIEGHDYRAWPNSQNSNSAVPAMLERAGFPVPDDPYGWTPGWERDLPEGSAIKGPIN